MPNRPGRQVNIGRSHGDVKRELKDLHESRQWRDAITQAETEIAKAQGRIVKLRQSIRFFKKRIAKGDPWPIEEQRQDASNAELVHRPTNA